MHRKLTAWMQNKEDRQCTCKRNVEALLRNYCCSGKATFITYSEFVFVTLGFQHAMRMHYIVICGLPALQYFSTLSHKRHLFFLSKKEFIENKMFLLSLQFLSEKFLILRRTQRDVIKNVFWFSSEVPVIIV